MHTKWVVLADIGKVFNANWKSHVWVHGAFIWSEKGCASIKFLSHHHMNALRHSSMGEYNHIRSNLAHQHFSFIIFAASRSGLLRKVHIDSFEMQLSEVKWTASLHRATGRGMVIWGGFLTLSIEIMDLWQQFSRLVRFCSLVVSVMLSIYIFSSFLFSCHDIVWQYIVRRSECCTGMSRREDIMLTMTRRELQLCN
jgi:hypothetical protein